MSRRRRFHYSASLAVIVTALAAFCDGYFVDNLVSFFILLPGIVGELLLEFLLMVSLKDGDLYAVPRCVRPILAACFYFAFSQLLLLAWKNSRRA
ncbi:MAG: hypothetical protein JOZ96_00825 [Acidobacteria bacterium]|nr:hypothetical protein [Acidobacteriota bacterium]